MYLSKVNVKFIDKFIKTEIIKRCTYLQNLYIIIAQYVHALKKQ